MGIGKDIILIRIYEELSKRPHRVRAKDRRKIKN